MPARTDLTITIGDLPEVRAAMESARGRIADLEGALSDAVNHCTGRVGQIGASSVYTPQIDVKAAERWRAVLGVDHTKPRRSPFPSTTIEVSEVRATTDPVEVGDASGNISYIPGETTYEAQLAAGGYAVIDRAEFERLARALASGRR